MFPEILPKSLIISKGLQKVFLTALVVVLVGAASFGLGRLSVLRERQPGVVVHSPGSLTNLASPAAAPVRFVPPAGAAKNFVASKNGTKYYAVGCGGASRIKPENQAWFATEADAKVAGYTPAANCSLLNQ